MIAELEDNIILLDYPKEIMEDSRRNSMFQSLNQLFSSSLSIEQTISNFDNFKHTTSKELTLKNIAYWFVYNWNQLSQDENLVTLIRDFLFTFCVTNLAKYPENIKELIGYAQAAATLRFFPQIWSNLFQETFFNTEQIDNALIFICGLCKLLMDSKMFNLSENLQFIANLFQSQTVEMFHNIIIAGIQAQKPQAYEALGYFSVAFSNQWVSDQQALELFMGGLGNQSTITKTLEGIYLLLQSPFSAEEKAQFLIMIDILSTLSNLDNVEYIVPGSKLLKIAFDLLGEDESAFVSIFEIAMVFFPINNPTIAISTAPILKSVAEKIPEYVKAICDAGLQRLYLANQTDPLVLSPPYVMSIMRVIETALERDPQFEQTVESFSEFLQSINPEEPAAATTLLQFIAMFRNKTIKLKVEDMFSRYSEIVEQYSFVTAAETWQEGIEPAQNPLVVAYVSSILQLPPKADNELLAQSLSTAINTLVILPEDCPARASILFLIQDYCNKFNKLTPEIISPDFIVSLIGMNNTRAATAAGNLFNRYNAERKEELIQAVMPAVYQLIENSPRRNAFYNASFFFTAGNVATDDVMQAALAVFSEFPFDDQLIGRYIEVITPLGARCLDVLGNLINMGGGVYYTSALANLASKLISCKDASSAVQNDLWKASIFARLLVSATEKLQQLIQYNYHTVDFDKYRTCIALVVGFAKEIYLSLPQELFDGLIQLLTTYMSLFSEFDDVSDKCIDMIFKMTRSPRPEFDVSVLFPYLHSFLFGDEATPKKKLITNMVAFSRQPWFEQACAASLAPFSLDEQLVQLYAHCFKSNENCKEIPAVLKNIKNFKYNMLRIQ